MHAISRNILLLSSLCLASFIFFARSRLGVRVCVFVFFSLVFAMILDILLVSWGIVYIMRFFPLFSFSLTLSCALFSYFISRNLCHEIEIF